VTCAEPTRRLLHVKDLIDARYAEPLDVNALAALAGLSRAHFSRQFHKGFGESPHQYLKSRRMERAAAQLRGTDYPIAKICAGVGLQSVGSFTTSFGRAYGLSPPPTAPAIRAAPRRSRPASCAAGRGRAS
jgi:AraC-like DNA-binding protein